MSTPLLRANGLDSTNVAYTPGNVRLQTGNVGGVAANYAIMGQMSPVDANGVATWYESTAGSVFHGTRRDWVFDMGWNLSAAGARIDTADAAVGDQWESYYEQDASNTWLERHFVYIDTNASYYRPLSFQMGRTGGTATNGGQINGYIAAGSFTFYDDNGPANAVPGNSFFRFAVTRPSPATTGWIEVANNAQFRKLVNNQQWLWQMNAAANNQLSIAYIDSANKVQLGVGSSAGGDAAGVIIGGTSSSTAINSSAITFDTGGNQWTMQFSVLFPTTNFNGAIGKSTNMPGSIYSMQYASKTQTFAAATNLTLNPGGGGEHFRITLSATAISTITVSAGLPGERITVHVIQDAAHTIPTTWTNVKFAGGVAVSPPGAGTAGKRDVYTLVYSDTDSLWYEASRALTQ